MNTSFIAQGNAFVAGLPNPKVDETSGGIWGRVIGGRVETSATTTFNGTLSGAPGQIGCNTGVRLNFNGFQLGQDIARLNIGGSGATLHVGVTGGYAEANAQNQVGLPVTGNFQVPFAGVYATFTKGNFFADILARSDFYQMSLTSADAVLSNQRLSALGGTLSTSAGYRVDLGNSWFIEPSASAIYSKVNVDTLNLPAGFGSGSAPFSLPFGKVQFSPNESILGRLGARVGTTFSGANILWQPFATASVWHEFAGDTMSTYNAQPAGTFLAGTIANSRVGTYGQYSAGVAAQVNDSPLLGYLRVDYRNGSNIASTSFNGGLRYNFDPTIGLTKPAGIFKAPAQAAVLYDWTGFYAGAFSGLAWGQSDWFFPQIGAGVNPRMAGGLLGGNVGYNKQLGPWVLGVEGDFAATNAKGGEGCVGGPNTVGGPPGQNCNNDLKWVATATAKIGYTWDRVLVYGKAGGAWTENKLDVSCNADSGRSVIGNATFSNCQATNSLLGAQNLVNTVSQFGWTVGAGFELALTPSWSARAEYDYMNFGSKTVTLPDTTVVNLKQDFNQVKVGINYHFGKEEMAVASAMPVKAAPVTLFNWTGVYVGAAIADRAAVSNWRTLAIDNHSGAGFVNPDPTTNPASFFSSNLQGRLYSGYNWQFSPKWVAGVEADFGFGDSRMKRGGIPGAYGNGINAFDVSNQSPGTDGAFHDSTTVKMGWDATIRGRLGMLVTPTVLFYATGGAALQRASVSAACDASFVFPPPLVQGSWCSVGGASRIAKSQTFSSDRLGWTVGVGIEGVLTGNWLGKVEARYADFGNYKNTFFAGTGDDVVTNVHIQTFTALAGVSYKFGPGFVGAR